MRSLFLRIFLWFWLAVALIGAALVVSSPLLTRSRPAIDRWQAAAEEALQVHLERAEQRLRHHGPSWRGGPRGHRGPVALHLFDADGELVEGPPPPPELRELVEKALADGGIHGERRGTLHLGARAITMSDGTRWVVGASLRRPPRPVDLLSPGELLPRLAVLALVAGVLCFWLARHLTRPVAALRGVTRRLAAGDLTARVGPRLARRRDEIGELARDFDAMAERLEDLLGAQRRLLRDVSHELRSPLARQAVAVELARGQTGGALAATLDRLERDGERLNELIGQLLVLARLEGGPPLEREEAVSLERLVAEVVADAEFETVEADRGIDLVRTAPAEVSGDPGLLRSAVENVVRNALRHTAPGTRVEVELATDGQTALIRVRDRGPGVAEDDLERMFEPFYRADAARSPDGGSGLGLAITRRAVERHGGSVRSANRSGGGLEVEIALPLAVSRA